ncbi:hypothetical protein [Paenibacillus medicaginis]|uniref:Uncharacterized protein n=1 Tax=Paenibacillus medicaginis TaxID=1470560 RepID=A0ABV5BVC0_9BACL
MKHLERYLNDYTPVLMAENLRVENDIDDVPRFTFDSEFTGEKRKYMLLINTRVSKEILHSFIKDEFAIEIEEADVDEESVCMQCLEIHSDCEC